MGDFPFAVQVSPSVIRNCAGGTRLQHRLGSCCFLFECASSQWKSLVDSARPRVSLEDRSAKCSPRGRRPQDPLGCALGLPGVLSAAGGAGGGGDRGGRAQSVLATEPADSQPHQGTLCWRALRVTGSSWLIWQLKQLKPQRQTTCPWACVVGGRARTVGNPPISISRVSFFCHSTELTHTTALHRPCRRMWLCWCISPAALSHFSPFSASLCVQEADPSVFQPLLRCWLVSNLHQPMGSTGRRLAGGKVDRAGWDVSRLSLPDLEPQTWQCHVPLWQ